MIISRHRLFSWGSRVGTAVCWLQAGYFRIYRKWCDFLGARWSGAASGARPRHVRVRMASRFSALQTKGRAKILQWRQMRAFSNFVSEWCGDVVTARAYRVAGRGDRVRGDVVTARFTRGPRPVHA